MPVMVNPHKLRSDALLYGIIATVIIPVNFFVFFIEGLRWLFYLLALAQMYLGFVAALSAAKYAKVSSAMGVTLTAFFGLVGLGGPFGMFLGWVLSSGVALGGAWGRPLRLRGRILHPELRLGSDWTRGEMPSVEGLDDATRRALEALWLHDAQKEHASVPAFARVSWVLAALGAPAELLHDAHVAATEEIDHTRKCFALAAGYGGRAHSVEPMPDLLVGGLDMKGAPFVALATESLKDGCLLEDYNADVAEACAHACEEPVTRSVLAQIAREERSHAELSWRLLAFALERGAEPVRRAVQQMLETLEEVPRPTAVSGEKQALVDAADPIAMRRHGRLPDHEWAQLWARRMELTRERVARLLTNDSTRAKAA